MLINSTIFHHPTLIDDDSFAKKYIFTFSLATAQKHYGGFTLLLLKGNEERKGKKCFSFFLLRFRADFHVHEQNEIGNREKTERERRREGR